MAKNKVTVLTTVCSVFVCLIGFLQHSAADCSVNTPGIHTFGSDCQFMCHCKDGTSCDTTTGECNQGCASTWYGPACQYRDLVEAQFSRHSSNIKSSMYASHAHDGNTSTCSYTINASLSYSQPWWRVWFPRNETIREIDLTTTETEKQYFEDGYEVTIEYAPESTMTDNTYFPPDEHTSRCFKYDGGPLRSKHIHVKCDTPLVGNQVRITLSSASSQLVLCDVRINGGRNFAFRKTVSSNSQGNDTSYLPSNAVDGIISSTGLTGCFASSESSDNKNLDIDLGRLYYIYSVMINKRTRENIRDYKLYDITTEHPTLLHDDKNNQPPLTHIHLNKNVQQLRIEKNTGNYLIICELQVFGECPENRCGYDCSENCYCSSSIEDIEQRISGVCTSGCQGRWTGINGKCNIECDATKWGSSCQSNCGACRTCPCDVVSGNCSGDCQDGYQNGNKCLNECQGGWYGFNCSLKCSKHCASGKCVNTNGVCQDGCEQGYSGDRCDKKCRYKTYGAKCNQTCNTQCIDVCNHVDGMCKNCAAGWRGDFCDKETTDDEKSSPTAIIAGFVSAAVVLTAIVLVVLFVILWRRKQNKRYKKPMETKLTSSVIDEAVEIQSTVYQTASRQPSNEDYIYDELEIRTDSVYYNTGLSSHRSSSLPVKLTDLAAYVKQGLSDFNFWAQFKEIPYGLQTMFETNAARNPDNTNDHCRVILKQSKSGPCNDYINASHIKGYQNDNEYIAAQGPMHTNVNEFWRMIWEKYIHVIVMVTKDEEERQMTCIPYWAPSNEYGQYDDIKIFTESESIFADFSVRRFKVYLKGSSLTRDIVHFTYKSWPDDGVPNTTSSLLHFWRRVRKIDPSKTYPWLVHCSNGVGRTGTFIALDFLYDQGQDTGQVNVFQCVKDLRNQRVNMVQTKEQYYHLYMVVLDALVLPSQPVTLDEFERQYKALIKIDTVSGNQRLKLDYQTLTEGQVVVYDRTWFGNSDVAKEKRLYETEYENKDKNRFPNILAQDEYRPRLGTSVAGTSTYINAIYIPGYCDSRGFVITQTPLPNTAIDHCRLIVEQEVQVTVTFDEEIETENVGKYLPDNGTVELKPFRVSVASEENKDGYIMRKHTLSYNSKVHPLTQFIYKAWAPSNVCPDDPNQMLDFLYDVDSLQKLTKNKPLIVECMNGAARSGLIIALMNILEYVRIDGEVSIPHVIRCLKARRQQIIPNYEQYKFCHDVFLCFVCRESRHAEFN